MKSPASYSLTATRRSTAVRDAEEGTIDPATRKIATRKFEEYSITQSYNIMLCWWQRIVVHNKRVKGWKLTPSHYLGNDLADVWLDE